MKIRLRKWILAGAILAAMSVFPFQANADIITNGNFSGNADAQNGYFTDLGFGSTAINGWTVGAGFGTTNGTVDWIGSYWAAPGGPNAHSIDLDGATSGSIWQTLTGLTIGSKYEISFQLSGNPDTGFGVKPLEVSVGNTSQDYQFVVAAGQNYHPVDAMRYVPLTFDFTAAAASVTLTFTSMDPYRSSAGPVVADVHGIEVPNSNPLTAVPEPSSLALLGVGAVGLVVNAIRRRRLK